MGVTLTRRRFVTILLAAAGGAAAVVAGFRVPLRRVYHRLTDVVLSKTPAGPLDEHVLNALLAATDAYAGAPVERGHYVEFFRWHAETLPGYRTLYERFAATVDRAARRSLGCDFAACEHAARQKIVARAFRFDRPATRLSALRAAFLERDWTLFSAYIARPITSLFAHTDAWRRAGYDAWPGIPQGLDRYTQAPRRGSR